VVDPISNDDRRRTLRRVRLGTVALVGVSAALMAAHAGAGVEVLAAAFGGGLLVGAALVWYLFPAVESIAPAAGRSKK